MFKHNVHFFNVLFACIYYRILLNKLKLFFKIFFKLMYIFYKPTNKQLKNKVYLY